MKKKVIMIAMTMVLSAAMMAGCGKDSAEGSSAQGSLATVQDNTSIQNDRDSDIKSNTGASTPATTDSPDTENNSRTNEDATNESASSKGSSDSTTAPSASGSAASDKSATPSENSTAPSDNSAAPSGNNATPSDNIAAPSGENKDSSSGGAASPAASAFSATDYLNDIKEILEMNNIELDDFANLTIEAMSDQLESIMNELNVNTPEGLLIKSDLQEVAAVVLQAGELLKNLDNIDEAALDNITKRMEELSELSKEHMDAFLKAAQDIGIDTKTLEDFKSSLGL